MIRARSLLAPESWREYPARTSLVSPLHTGVVSRHTRAILNCIPYKTFQYLRIPLAIALDLAMSGKPLASFQAIDNFYYAYNLNTLVNWSIHNSYTALTPHKQWDPACRANQICRRCRPLQNSKIVSHLKLTPFAFSLFPVCTLRFFTRIVFFFLVYFYFIYALSIFFFFFYQRSSHPCIKNN